MEKRFPMTWSFEGTRSRLGKLMPPKYGLLKYVLEGAHHAGARNIHIIPVSVSYDLVRDAEEYAREQSGVPKTPESIGWMVRYLRSLARPMGRIHVDFGEPVHLASAPDRINWLYLRSPSRWPLKKSCHAATFPATSQHHCWVLFPER